MKMHLAPPGTNQAANDNAVLDEAHIGHINGALGTIAQGDIAPRPGLSRKTKTLLAIIGPGLIVMAGDIDAGAFSTYAQAGRTTARSCCGRSCSLRPSSTSTKRWCFVLER